jgi:predicted DNA-binding transcriptional regulator YafY
MAEGKPHYQSELATFLECSPQTVGRLIQEIESVVGDNLVVGTENRRRYYQLKSYSGRKCLGLDFEELRYLNICHDLAAPHLPIDVSERIQKTIFSLSVLMADPDYCQRENVQGRQIGFKSKGRIDYTEHFGHLEKLIEAARSRNVCLVEYRANARKEAQTYFYAPGKIFSMNDALYVQGYKVSKGLFEKDRPTTFAIHRIFDVTRTDKTFSFDATVDDDSHFGLKWHEPKRYRIRFKSEAADYVRERMWSEDQKIEELTDGGIILELSSVSERELMAWVWSFGELARVIE